MLKSATSASGARLANTGRGLPRPIDSGDGTGRLTPWQGGAVNLWTGVCPDPRLTAPARPPMDEPGKTPCVSPALPTGRRLPTSFTATRNKTGGISFRGKVKPAPGHRALAYSSPEAVQTTGTVAEAGFDPSVPLYILTVSDPLLVGPVTVPFAKRKSPVGDRVRSVRRLLLPPSIP